MWPDLSNSGLSAHTPKDTGTSYVVVKVNIYDFVKRDTYSGSLLSFFGLGIHHSGLQIEDKEWTFNPSGIISMPGLRMPGCRLNESISLGKYWGAQEEIEAVLADLQTKYRPGTYNIINQNCNHFVEEFAQKLIGVSIPNWVNRSANIAGTLGFTTNNVVKQRTRGQSPPRVLEAEGAPRVAQGEDEKRPPPRVDSMVLI